MISEYSSTVTSKMACKFCTGLYFHWTSRNEHTSVVLYGHWLRSELKKSLSTSRRHTAGAEVDCVWSVMAHAQKPDFICRLNWRVHLNRRGRQFSRLLAAEVCESAVVMLDTSCSEVAWNYWLPTPFASFPFTSPPVRHCVPSCFNWTLQLHTWTSALHGGGWITKRPCCFTPVKEPRRLTDT